MAYVPDIRNYKPFYIETVNDNYAWDTTTYGMVAQTQPFPASFEVKEPYKNNWLDENGDDEYVPYTLPLKAFEYTVKFFVKTLSTDGSTPIEKLNYQVNNFLNKMIGFEFKIWDSWQERGFQKVRFVKSVVEERDITDESAWMIFSVTLKVNDPATAVTLSSNHITATS